LLGSIASLAYDGGKDIAKQKLIVTGLVTTKEVFPYRIVNTENNVLDAHYHCNLLVSVLSQLLKDGVLVVAVNMDNEASPNAGADLLSNTDFGYVLHLRYLLHTKIIF
jgi:hypothetical protein